MNNLQACRLVADAQSTAGLGGNQHITSSLLKLCPPAKSAKLNRMPNLVDLQYSLL